MFIYNRLLLVLLLYSSIGWSKSATIKNLNIQFDTTRANAWNLGNPVDSFAHLLEMFKNPDGFPATIFPTDVNDTTIKPSIDYSNMVPVQEEKIIKVNAYTLCSANEPGLNCGNELDGNKQTSTEQSTLPAGDVTDSVKTEANHQVKTTSSSSVEGKQQTSSPEIESTADSQGTIDHHQPFSQQEHTTTHSPSDGESNDNPTTCPPHMANKGACSTSTVQTLLKTFTKAFAGQNPEPEMPIDTSIDKIS